jgi:hypothetical protein
VLHEESILPVKEKNIPLNIRNTNRPQDAGTMILENIDEKLVQSKRFITGIAGRKSFTVLTIYQKHISTEHYFRFLDTFRDEYLPYAIELGRSFVHPNYQSTRANAKSLYVMDNVWDGLGAIMINNPDKKYFFGKVTMYGHYNTEARNMLMYFLHKHFPAKEGLLEPIHPVELGINEESMERLFVGDDYAEDHKILTRELKERGEFIPPMINSYMNVSPSMMVFDTVINPDFGEVEETGILITIADLYPHKLERHTRGLKRLRRLRKLFDHTMIAIDKVVTGKAASTVKVALRRRKAERTRRVARDEKNKE